MTNRAELITRIAELEAFAKDVRDNWDCECNGDSRYTPCRSCKAHNVLPEVEESPPDEEAMFPCPFCGVSGLCGPDGAYYFQHDIKCWIMAQRGSMLDCVSWAEKDKWNSRRALLPVEGDTLLPAAPLPSEQLATLRLWLLEKKEFYERHVFEELGYGATESAKLNAIHRQVCIEFIKMIDDVETPAPGIYNPELS